MVLTYKNKFNLKYGFDKNASHSIDEIAKLTGYQKKGLEIIFDKGVGAFKTNPQSVRKNVLTPEHWGHARVYSAVMGGKSAKIDASHLLLESKGEGLPLDAFKSEESTILLPMLNEIILELPK